MSHASQGWGGAWRLPTSGSIGGGGVAATSVEFALAKTPCVLHTGNKYYQFISVSLFQLSAIFQLRLTDGCLHLHPLDPSMIIQTDAITAEKFRLFPSASII